MLNYNTWLQRAADFTQGLKHLPGDIRVETALAPPLSDEEVRTLAQPCRLPVPGSLRRFWMEASGHCHCRYTWDVPAEFHQQWAVAFPGKSHPYIWGGAEFESPSSIVELTRDSLDFVALFRDRYPKDARFWGHSLPLIPVGNGDYVGLYVRDVTDDPPVAYLCHEGCGASHVMAANLDDFLARWEQLGYIGIDFLHFFTNTKTGILVPGDFPVETESIRTLLCGEARPDLVKPPVVVTEIEWASSVDPDWMLRWMEDEGRLEDRKLRLFCCACCHRMWGQMGPYSRSAVDVAERFADGLAGEVELEEARMALNAGDRGRQVHRDMFPIDTYRRLVSAPDSDIDENAREDMLQRFGGALQETMAFSKAQGPMHRLAYAAVDASRFVSSDITQHLDEPELTSEKAAHAELVRHIFGNPFRPVVLASILQTNVIELAKRLYDGKGSAAELAESLNAAGEEDLAEHFSHDDHPKGCWALDAILGK
jgi:hypothetical protein